MRAATAASLAVLVCILAACGSGSGPPVPRGNPDARHGPTAVDDYAAVELLRSLLIGSSDGYFAGGSAADARAQLSRARAAYDALAGRVKAKDPVVDREVVARFDLLERDMRRGIRPDHYRALAGPLFDQLMDGVAQALVPQPARSDRGLQAEALRRVTTRLAATYDAATTSAGGGTAHLAFEEAWGLWRRAQVLSGLIQASLGSESSAVTGSLNNLRGSAFPNGPREPGSPPSAKVDSASTKIVDALNRRFAL
jgi:hypothetical protein